jgi:leader peptidase (prepilin peptidase)/N-methyltransferase
MIFEAVIVLIAGLCIGSFLNVCIYRLPKEKSIVTPRSFCIHCKKTIPWYDNIPVISYLLLRGRCRACGKPIALRYLIVEALVAAVFVLSYLTFGFGFVFAKYLILFSLCVLVSFIDIDYRAIPGWLCILGIVLGLGISSIETLALVRSGEFVQIPVTQLPLVRSFQGLFLCIGLSYFLKLMGDLGLWIYLALRKKDSIEGEKESLGLGDVDFLGMVGAFLGWQLGFLTFFLAPLVSLVYCIYIVAFKKSHLIAYLPFLSIATFISAFWGISILKFLFPF